MAKSMWFKATLIACLVSGCAAMPPQPAIAPVLDPGNVEHYVWGQINDGWRFVDRADLSVIRERMKPGGKEVRHYHVKARQFFYVLTGEFTMELNGVSHTLHPGQGIEIPPGSPHQAQNLSAADAEFMTISQPTSKGDRVEAPK
jgi:mannose-6-phosphate isomerase-like protein (cupin superfamily)